MLCDDNSCDIVDNVAERVVDVDGLQWCFVQMLCTQKPETRHRCAQFSVDSLQQVFKKNDSPKPVCGC
jgi:hypothetical protein